MSAPDPELARLRGSIDNLDSALVCLLAERFKITQRVGELKAELGLPPADPQREAQQIERLPSPVQLPQGLARARGGLQAERRSAAAPASPARTSSRSPSSG